MGADSSCDDLGNGRTLISGNENSNYGHRACRGNFCFCALDYFMGDNVKIGDLVKLKRGYSPVGIIISMQDSSTGEWAKIKWSDRLQTEENWRDLEVVNEAGGFSASHLD